MVRPIDRGRTAGGAPLAATGGGIPMTGRPQLQTTPPVAGPLARPGNLGTGAPPIVPPPQAPKPRPLGVGAPPAMGPRPRPVAGAAGIPAMANGRTAGGAPLAATAVAMPKVAAAKVAKAKTNAVKAAKNSPTSMDTARPKARPADMKATKESRAQLQQRKALESMKKRIKRDK